MTREDAYRLVQSHAMQAWNSTTASGEPEVSFRALIERDPAVTSRLSPEKIAAAFDVKRQLANIDAVFTRVLAEG